MTPTTPSATGTLVQLAPPGSGGVADYMNCIHDRWRDAGLRSVRLQISADDAADVPLSERLCRIAHEGGGTVALLLHFSAYGFQKRGLCFWLLRELEAARAALGDALRLTTMFHELHASGPPWKSAFWLSGAQAWITGKIARSSSQLVTNSNHHASRLREHLHAIAPLQVWPVFSTVGEPVTVPRIDAREPRLVVFGAESTRRRAAAQLPRHAAWLRRQGVREVIEVGSGSETLPSGLGFERRFAGRLDAAALSGLLERTSFALLEYPSLHLSKSTVFAAYAAHGCVTLDAAPVGPAADGLEDGRHYLSLDRCGAEQSTAQDHQAMSDLSRSWYLTHPLATQAASMAGLCAGAAPPERQDA